MAGRRREEQGRERKSREGPGATAEWSDLSDLSDIADQSDPINPTDKYH